MIDLLALLDGTVPAPELGRRSFHVGQAQLIVGAIAACLSLACVLFHFEVMSWSSRVVPGIRLVPRMRIVLLVLAMLLAHVVEMWAFGLTYWVLDAWPSLGHLEGTFDEGAVDFIYFSVTSFTTLGFGDIVPKGAVRILCGTEALVGLSLITWSASFAFLQMQRDWAEFSRGTHQD